MHMPNAHELVHGKFIYSYRRMINVTIQDHAISDNNVTIKLLKHAGLVHTILEQWVPTFT